MKTECPHCHTLFRVSDQQIQNAAGQVRCGYCLAIFTAELPRQMSFDDLLDEDSESVVEDFLEQPDAAASFDLETAAQNNTADITGFDEPFSTVGDHASRHVLPDVIPPSLRAETRDGRKRFGFIFSFFWFLAALLLIGIGLAQYAWYERLQLLQHPQTRPWVELACQYLHCQLPEPKDVSRMELIRKNIYSHPNDKQSLMVSGSMINQAEFAQGFPLLELRFENIRGETIAARRFKPAEYLDLPADQIAKMEPATPVAFTLEITDPGAEVVSYEFRFF